MTALAIIHKAEIVEKLAQGIRLDDMGLGISHQAISRALKDDPDYRDAMISYHAARLDRSEMMIEGAEDSVAVARARAFNDAVRWRAAREQRDIWGDKPMTVDIHIGAQVDDALGSIADQVISKMRVVSDQKDEG